MADSQIDIKNMSRGYSADGVETYIQNIQSDFLKTARKDLLDTESVKDACDRLWAGRAKDNFKINFQKDAEHVADQMTALYVVLVGEINSILTAMAEHDRDLIEVK